MERHTLSVQTKASSPGVIVACERLVDDILGASQRIVIIEAAAGMGKSTLLAQIARRAGVAVHTGSTPPLGGASVDLAIWDIPAGGALRAFPETHALPQRLVIAKRPGWMPPRLGRLLFYGDACRIDPEALLFTAEDLSGTLPPDKVMSLLAECGGWPALTMHQLKKAPNAAQLQLFLATDVLPELAAPELVVLGQLLDGEQPTEVSAKALLPLVRQGNAGSELLPCLRGDVLRDAWRTELTSRMTDAAQGAQLADAYLSNGRATQAITLLQEVAFLDVALDLFVDAGGLFYVYRYGGADYDRVLAGFPESFTCEHEVLVVSRAMQALKRGDVGRARQVLNSYVAAAGRHPAGVINNAASYSLQMRYFRLMMLIYEDIELTDELLDQAFRLLSDMPVDADLERGCVLNAIMEFYMRRRHFAQGEDIAARSHRHYTVAQVPILQFYINLHRTIMRLSSGDVISAGRFADEAARELKEAHFDSPSDARLLRMVQACVSFEGGRSGPLIDFLDRDLEGLTQGEMWPSIAECMLHYGSQTLAEHFSMAAARDFLNRWRVYQQYNHQFQTMIKIREAVTLQNGNRWHEAADKLASVPSRITRNYVQRSGEDLARLEDRDEIFLALAWLRHLVFEAPRDPALEELIGAMLNNLQLTGRQRFSVEIWQAYLYRNQRNPSRARLILQKTLEEAGRRGALAPLAEENVFLSALMGNQRISEFVLTSPIVRQVMRRLSEVGVSLRNADRRSGLTRREFRVLLLITEGASNKFIANALGLSEATVKFHLGNVYRKLGCGRRKEAISTAKSMGLVS